MEKLYKVSRVPKGLILFFTLFFATQFSFAQGQDINVTGTVTSSEDNSGIVGVTVMVKGTTNATITDIDGKYSIIAPENSVLEFSSMGYTTQEFTVTGGTIDVVLQESTETIDQVVVIGYGTQRKEAVTGSVASISGNDLREMPVPNISQALQGRLAGVEINQSSSQPGAAMQIRIRGVRSLTGSNDPLIVLDGIPFSGAISDIATDDIKTIDILKDASATAIYGSRGANGVVLITTKKGSKGQEAKFSYDSFYGVKNAIEFPMMSGPKFVQLRAAAGMFTNGLDEADDVNTDWQDLFYRTGTVQNHHVSVTGGTEKGSYNFSTTYYKEEAVVPLQDYERLSLFASLDQELGNYVKIGFSSNSNYSVTNGSNLGLYGVLSQSPIANPYNEDGSFKRTIQMPLDEQWVYTRGTLNALGDSYINQTRSYATYNSVYGEVKVPGVEGLKFRMNLGGNLRAAFGGSYTGEGVFATTADTPSSANVSNSLSLNWTVENILSYDRTFGKHNFSALALYSAQQDKYNSSSVSARDIPADAFQFYNLGRADGEITVNPDNQSYSLTGLTSVMGRVMYSYDDKYMVSAAYRADGSSRLAPGNKWHNYPAVSAGWNIANEPFMEGVETINQLKLRVGYGETSNQAVAPYKTLGVLGSRPYNFGDQYATGFYVSELPSPSLGWEYTKSWNYGVDFGLFGGRLSGTLEYYVQKTNDVLMQVNLPVTSGANSYTDNVANTENKGIELSLNGTIIDNPDGFSFDAGFNIYANRNKITSLSSGVTEDVANWWFVGQPVNVIYDYNNIGLWQEGDPYMSILEPGASADANADYGIGMIKVEYTGEYNADGTPVRAIGQEDRKVLDVNPDFQGGFNTHMSYKGFDLGIVGGFQSGGILISTLYGTSGYLNLMSGRRGQVDVDYWTPDNTDARYPNPRSQRSSDSPRYSSTLAYFDASYVKIRTITLGYNFTQSFIKNAGIDRLRLYATLQNPLVIWSPYYKETGLDPEPNSYGNQNQAVNTSIQSRLLTVGTNTPATRSFMFGLNITF